MFLESPVNNESGNLCYKVIQKILCFFMNPNHTWMGNIRGNCNNGKIIWGANGDAWVGLGVIHNKF